MQIPTSQTIGSLVQDAEGLWDYLGDMCTGPLKMATAVSCDGDVLDEADIPGATLPQEECLQNSTFRPKSQCNVFNKLILQSVLKCLVIVNE